MRLLSLSIAALLIALLTPIAKADDEVAFGCQDLVVVGTIRSLTWTPINDPDDLLGHGLWSTEIRIERVLRGAERRHRVYATVISHAQIREDTNFLIVLSELGGPGYVIESFDAAGDAHLASECTVENNGVR
jgi:hypothetical protein